MARASKRSDSEKSMKDITQVAVFSESAMRHNMTVLERTRTCQAAVSGMASGILGLTGVAGFVFYFIIVIVQAFIWEWKASFHWRDYFIDRTISVTHSIISGLYTYVLFWVFLYGMVHVY